MNANFFVTTKTFVLWPVSSPRHPRWLGQETGLSVDSYIFLFNPRHPRSSASHFLENLTCKQLAYWAV